MINTCKKISFVLVMLTTLFVNLSSTNAALKDFSLKMPCEVFIQKYNGINDDNPYIPKIVATQETAKIEQAIFLTSRPRTFITIIGQPYQSGAIEMIAITSEQYDEDLNYVTNTFLGVLNTMDFPYDADAWAQINKFFNEIVDQRKRISDITLINKKTNEQWNCHFERTYDKITNRFQGHLLAIHNDLFYSINQSIQHSKR